VLKHFLITISIFASVNFIVLGQSAKLHVKTGEQFLENGMLNAALEELDKAIMLDPNECKTYQVKAIVLLKLNDSLNAADNYRKAAALKCNSEYNFLEAAKIFYQYRKSEIAEECIEQGLAIKPKNIDLLIYKTKLLFERESYGASYETADKAVSIKDLAIAYYYRGANARLLNKFEQAESDLNKAITRDSRLTEAYLELATLQNLNEEYDEAIENTSVVLLLHDPMNTKALKLRSIAFHAKKNYEQAIADITKAISIEKNNYGLYMKRAKYNMDYALYSNAIDDYTLALNLNDTLRLAYKFRAKSYEQIGKNKEAIEDYKRLLVMMEPVQGFDQLKKLSRKKIFDLGREQNKPEINLMEDLINNNAQLIVKENTDTIKISGLINEESIIQEVKLNNIPVTVTKKADDVYSFNVDVKTEGLNFVTITVTDLYDNITTETYTISRIETKKPEIKLISPIAGFNETIALETDDNTLYIEGRVEDISRIKTIKVDEVNASFAPGDYNPKFTATIDVRNRKNVAVTAIDEFGNEATKTYEFVKGNYLLSDVNPMGKTWVVIIQNSHYKEYTDLQSPEKDVSDIKSALENYQISKVLVKQNMAKHEMERFFAIDLRDLIVSNNVNSLLIWYAGHGQNINNTGYWVPVDGKLNDEYSYYNINALKASLYSYSSLTHFLLVSDACEAGGSFTTAMRGDNSLASCDDATLINQKSALVLTSSNMEAAMDNSLFTQTFVNSLLNNPADCLPIDAIAERISIVMYKHSAQKPTFGRISGLEDKAGTFFFMRK